MREYSFDHPPVVPGGRVVFRVRNDGQLDHELQLVRLPEGFPPIDAQLRSSERQALPTLALLARQTGSPEGTFAVDVDPGRYAMICFVKDGDGVPHALKGMSSEFTVR